MKPFPEDEAPRNQTYREYLLDGVGILDFSRHHWDGVIVDIYPTEQLLNMDAGKVWELTYGLACVLEKLGLARAHLKGVSPTTLSTTPPEIAARQQARERVREQRLFQRMLDATKDAETSPDPEHLS